MDPVEKGLSVLLQAMPRYLEHSGFALLIFSLQRFL